MEHREELEKENQALLGRVCALEHSQEELKVALQAAQAVLPEVAKNSMVEVHSHFTVIGQRGEVLGVGE